MQLGNTYAEYRIHSEICMLMARAEAPEAIRMSSQFNMACREGAVLMRQAP